MARRVAFPYWFRAEGARIPWGQIAERQARFAGRRFVEPRRLRPFDVQLRWSCAKELGVPFEPFLVWRRSQKDRPDRVEVDPRPVDDGAVLTFHRVVAYVEVECDPIDPSRAVGLIVTRGGLSLNNAVGSAAAFPVPGARVRLVVRCSGGTRALLINGHNPSVRIETLDQVVNDGEWKPFERVGLPVDDPWSGTSYDTSEQGLLDAPVSPLEAALQRLARGGPQVGWFPATSTGRTAPPWSPPDHLTLLKEVRDETLPRIEAVYGPALKPRPYDQQLLEDTFAVDGPSAAHPAEAKLSPLSLLALPASADPFLSLALGFGTAYAWEGGQEGPFVGNHDLMVTGDYEDLPDRSGSAQLAAYVPAPGVHSATATPTNVTAVRDGLVAPEVPDATWRETIRVSWDRRQASAALGLGTGAALARFDSPGDPSAECLLPLRAAGGFRPLLPVPDGPLGTPGFGRTGMVDAAAEIPVGSGGRQPGYPVAWQDVFGVWSRWDDALYAGGEPAPPRPRIVAMTLGTLYAGTTQCPATLEVELALDWFDRTPVAVDVFAVFFPMTLSTTPPPAGVTPFGPAPAGCFRRDASLPFAGAELQGGGGVAVEHLDSAGEDVVVPGPAQGEESRRYRVRISVPTLDFGATSRWGVALWTRSDLLIGATSALAPGLSPALTSAASPVPVAPIPPPPPPGVPMGSALDAQGRSHARVYWSIPAGADLQPDKGIIVWEIAETALRQSVGLPDRAPEGTLPGVRLQQLWNAYDAMPADQRRAVFRRLLVLPGSARETDVALPKGSTDIHLFVVTTLSRSGIESSWPTGGHEDLQAVAAPRLRRPAAPMVSSVLGASGAVTLSLSSMSRVPVREFRVFRTRSEVAARSFETMGPAFATVPAALSVAAPDPVTGELTYEAAWSGAFPASWDDWFVRAVAVAVDSVPVEAVRGLPSPAGAAVLVRVLPPLGPDLAPLVAVPIGSGELVLVTTSTSAPMRDVPQGSHRVSVGVSGAGATGVNDVDPVPLQDVTVGPVVAGAAPTGAAPGAVLVRGDRAAGRTPLAVWLTRADATQPLDVAVRVADPIGRLTTGTVTVPPVTVQPPTLVLLDAFAIAGRGVIVQVRSDAPIDAQPPYVLAVAARRAVLFPGAVVRASFELDDIPRRLGPFPPVQPIQAVRMTDDQPHEYQVLIRVLTPMTATLAMVAPNGERAQVSVSV